MEAHTDLSTGPKVRLCGCRRILEEAHAQEQGRRGHHQHAARRNQSSSVRRTAVQPTDIRRCGILLRYAEQATAKKTHCFSVQT